MEGAHQLQATKPETGRNPILQTYQGRNNRLWSHGQNQFQNQVQKINLLRHMRKRRPYRDAPHKPIKRKKDGKRSMEKRVLTAWCSKDKGNVCIRTYTKLCLKLVCFKNSFI